MSQTGKQGNKVIFSRDGKVYETAAIVVPQQVNAGEARALVQSGQATEIEKKEADKFPWLTPPLRG